MHCPLCGDEKSRAIFSKTDSGHGAREYFECPACRLVFVPGAQHVSADAARDFYGNHQNDATDERYIDYLRTLALPVRRCLSMGARGLDYGCGPAPAMGIAMGEGFEVADYDPLYRKDPGALSRTYDFITCCEAAEHFGDPGAEFARLDALLRPGGVLGIRTEPRDPGGDFGAWWYHRDPTHIAFYSVHTMEWIAQRCGWRLTPGGGNVFLFQK